MRLWSLHPVYLDCKGLTALWREGLLAQKVLSGNTKGYRNHPQLERFKRQVDPLAAIGVDLLEVQHEASRRGYRFDASKILLCGETPRIGITSGQLAYEFAHLKIKLESRDKTAYQRIAALDTLRAHPLFEEVGGGIERWEVGAISPAAA